MPPITALTLALLATPLPARLPAAPLPVAQEPHHHVRLQNEFVEVLRVSLPPGESTVLHTHAEGGGAVLLARATVVLDAPGQPSRGPVSLQPGDVSARPSGTGALPHRVRNAGTTPFEALDVELRKRPAGPAVEALAPPAAENDGVRVYRWRLEPGAMTPQHSHRRPYLVVAATPLQLLMQAPDGGRFEHAVAAGDVHWVDMPVTHTLSNTGAAPGVIVEIEIK